MFMYFVRKESQINTLLVFTRIPRCNQKRLRLLATASGLTSRNLAFRNHVFSIISFLFQYKRPTSFLHVIKWPFWKRCNLLEGITLICKYCWSKIFLWLTVEFRVWLPFCASSVSVFAGTRNRRKSSDNLWNDIQKKDLSYPSGI